MQAQGIEWGEDYRRAAAQALKDVLEGRPGSIAICKRWPRGEARRIVAVKSTVHFLADFAPIAAEVIFADSPGAHPYRFDRVPFRHLRPGLRLGPNGPPSG